MNRASSSFHQLVQPSSSFQLNPTRIGFPCPSMSILTSSGLSSSIRHARSLGVRMAPLGTLGACLAGQFIALAISLISRGLRCSCPFSSSLSIPLTRKAGWSDRVAQTPGPARSSRIGKSEPLVSKTDQ